MASIFPSTRIITYPDADTLAEKAAHRLLKALSEAQARRGEATIVLTGGSIGTKTLKILADAESHDKVDWAAVNFWWSDERFVSANSPDRNSFQAKRLCLARLPVDEKRVHPIPSSDDCATAAEASEAYSRLLLAAGTAERRDREEERNRIAGLFSQLPLFDVAVLGVGPDAHIASLFPGKTGISVTDALTISLTDSPKPPTERISLTLPSINTASEVWFLVSGKDKAEAVARATNPAADVFRCPAAGASGRDKTLWLVDSEAASLL